MRSRRLALGLLLTLSAVGFGAQADAGPPALVARTDAKCKALAQENFFVPTRGGEVFVRLVLPSCPDPARAKVPVILTYSPYALLSANANDMANFNHRGYARAVADVVGTGNSGGCWDYGGAREQMSAYDLVEWLGTREWSNGKVAMIGASYDGTTANMAAVAPRLDGSGLGPPHLATIVPQVAISDWYGYAYGDGVRYFAMDPAQRQGLVIDEQGFDTPVTFDATYGAVPPDPRSDPTAAPPHAIERACLGRTDKADHTVRAYTPNSDYDAFWRTRGYINDAASVRIPVLVEGGWRDYNVKHSESSRWFTALTNAPFKMFIMGQDAHGLPTDAANLDPIHHAWFDTFLYGFDGHDADHPDTFITSQPQSISKTSDGVVRVDATWPPPSTSPVRLAIGPHELTTGSPHAGGTETLIDTGLASESRALNEKGTGTGDSLWYESAPLKQDVRISGLPQLHLSATTLGTSTHFTPVLFDLGTEAPATPAAGSSLCVFLPPQSACVMSRGFLNARYRNGLATGEDLVPNAPYTANVRFIDNDWVVKAGHRIGLAIMSSNVWWATPDPERTITSISDDASALFLPIVGGADAATAAGL